MAFIGDVIAVFAMNAGDHSVFVESAAFALCDVERATINLHLAEIADRGMSGKIMINW